MYLNSLSFKSTGGNSLAVSGIKLFVLSLSLGILNFGSFSGIVRVLAEQTESSKSVPGRIPSLKITLFLSDDRGPRFNTPDGTITVGGVVGLTCC